MSPLRLPVSVLDLSLGFDGFGLHSVSTIFLGRRPNSLFGGGMIGQLISCLASSP
jgi:hypothetical protein